MLLCPSCPKECTNMKIEILEYLVLKQFKTQCKLSLVQLFSFSNWSQAKHCVTYTRIQPASHAFHFVRYIVMSVTHIDKLCKRRNEGARYEWMNLQINKSRFPRTYQRTSMFVISWDYRREGFQKLNKRPACLVHLSEFHKCLFLLIGSTIFRSRRIMLFQ